MISTLTASIIRIMSLPIPWLTTIWIKLSQVPPSISWLLSFHNQLIEIWGLLQNHCQWLLTFRHHCNENECPSTLPQVSAARCELNFASVNLFFVVVGRIIRRTNEPEPSAFCWSTPEDQSSPAGIVRKVASKLGCAQTSWTRKVVDNLRRPRSRPRYYSSLVTCGQEESSIRASI